MLLPKRLTVLALLISATLVCDTRAGEPNYLFPDLLPFVREDQPWLVNWDISDNRLRVQTVFANIGDGLFQIRTDSTIAGPPTTPVVQRVFIDNDNGALFEDFAANSAVAFHGSHGHIHFEDFSEFQLLEATQVDGRLGVGDLVVNEVKTSFSLRDSIRLPGPEWADAISYPSSHQGIYQNVSVGHGDLYSHGTDGQSLSLDGVEFGPRYWLRQIVDPSDVIRETDETNNVFEILIDLNNPGEALLNLDGTFAQPGDPPPARRGDLTLDGLITVADWTAFQAALGTDLTGLNDMELLLHGDFNLDRLHDIRDVIEFRLLFDEANGIGAFASLTGGVAPEPSAAATLLVAATGLAAWRRRRRTR